MTLMKNKFLYKIKLHVLFVSHVESVTSTSTHFAEQTQLQVIPGLYPTVAARLNELAYSMTPLPNDCSEA